MNNLKKKANLKTASIHKVLRLFCFSFSSQSSSPGPRPGVAPWRPAQEHSVGCGNSCLHWPRLQTDAGKKKNAVLSEFSKQRIMCENILALKISKSRVEFPGELHRTSSELLISCVINSSLLGALQSSEVCMFDLQFQC